MVGTIKPLLTPIFSFGVVLVTVMNLSLNPAHATNHQPVGLQNPLGTRTLQEFLVDILNVIVILAIPLIVFFIIYSGFLYVTARGNAEQVSKATRALTYSIIGGVLVLGAAAIAGIVETLVNSFNTP